jgi:hypothetical protein
MKTYKITAIQGLSRKTFTVYANNEQEAENRLINQQGHTTHIISVKEKTGTMKRYIITLDDINSNIYRDFTETHIIDATSLPDAISKGRRMARLNKLRFIRARYIKRLSY